MIRKLIAILLSTVMLSLGLSSLCFAEAEVFDIHNETMESYLADSDLTNVTAYAKGKKELSKPEPYMCDFSEDEGIGEGEAYVVEIADNPEFTDARCITGLSEKTYKLYNLLLGEHFYWRGGLEGEALDTSPVHEVIVDEKGPRVCLMEGVTNIRDIGGYDSYLVEGGKIRQGLYYRGAKLNDIKKKGKPRFTDELGIQVEIDLRDEGQCGGPYVDGTDYVTASIPSGTEEIRFEEFAEEYCKIFETVANAGDAPVYLHCSAGADRTGIVTCMLLAVCGVSYEDIARDYLLTNFSTQGVREMDEFNSWMDKLSAFGSPVLAENARLWMMSKGISEDTIEKIRMTFVEGYN